MSGPRAAAALVAGGVLVLGAVVGGGGGARAGATSPSSLTCGSDRLAVTWRGTTGGLAGHGGDLFWIRNDGSRACSLAGYARVAYDTRTGPAALGSSDQRGLAAARIGVYRARVLPVVRLAPRGGLASFWVFGEDVQPPCPVLSTMVVTLPATRGRADLAPPRIYASWPFCGSSVTVYPVVPGESGSLPPVPLREEIMATG